MAEYKTSCKKLFEHVLQKFVSGNHFTPNHANDVKSPYSNFLQRVLNKSLVAFQKYNIYEKLLDYFFMSSFGRISRFPQLIEIVKLVMVLSHGQSVARRGFSVNKNLLVENVHEKSLVCQRIVFDHMKSNDYNSFDIPLEKDLVKSVKGSNRKYIDDLAEKKKKYINNQSIMALNQKKTLLENTIAELKKDSDA